MSAETIQVDKVFLFQNVYIEENLRKGSKLNARRVKKPYICDIGFY